MADLKLPAVFLGFDDVYIDAWYSTFVDSEFKVTFYPTNLKATTDVEWEKLRKLGQAGHTIGFHGTDHLRAGVEITAHGSAHFLENEILPGLKLFAEHGLNLPLHYSYPWGNRTPQSDALLLGLFRTLRVGGSKVYGPRELRGGIFQAANWRKGHDNLLKEIIRRKAAAFLYLHTPMPNRLKVLWGYKNTVNFYPMDALNA